MSETASKAVGLQILLANKAKRDKSLPYIRSENKIIAIEIMF